MKTRIKSKIALTSLISLTSSCNKTVKKDSYYLQRDELHIVEIKRRFRYQIEDKKYLREEDMIFERTSNMTRFMWDDLCDAINNNPINKENIDFVEDKYDDVVYLNFIFEGKIDYQYTFSSLYGPGRMINNIENWTFTHEFKDYYYEGFLSMRNTIMKWLLDDLNPYISKSVTELSE